MSVKVASDEYKILKEKYLVCRVWLEKERYDLKRMN